MILNCHLDDRLKKSRKSYIGFGLNFSSSSKTKEDNKGENYRLDTNVPILDT